MICTDIDKNSPPIESDLIRELSSGSLRRDLIDMDAANISDRHEIKVVRRQNFLVTAVLICNSMVGSGILNQAQVFSNAGIAATTFLYAVSVSTLWLGGVVLIEAAEKLELDGARLDYSVLAYVTHGKKGAYYVDSSIAVLNFSANLSYILLIGSLASSLFQSWTGLTESFYAQSAFWSPVLTFLLILPPCLSGHFTSLPSFAYMCLTCALVIMMLVLFFGPEEGVEDRLNDSNGLLWWNWKYLFSKAGSVIFSLAFAPSALHAYIGLQPRNSANWRKSVTIALFGGAIICYITGLIGYLCFRSDTEGNILDNFYGSLADAASILLILHLVWYTPFEFIVLRHSVLQMLELGPLTISNRVRWFSSIVLLILLVLIVVIFDVTGIDSGNAFGIILDISGGIGGSLICFVLPAIIYKRVLSDGYWSTACSCMQIYGISMTILVPVTTIWALID